MRHRRPAPAPRHRASAPEERSLTDPRFVGGFPRADHPLDPPLPEIAFIGRSNVGKSSLLNALAGARIARVSATPGKTTMLNVYAMPEAFYFLDLPGYGYARASHTERASFRGLVRHTIERPRLRGVVWLLDIRRDPSPEDRGMQDLLVAAGTPVLAAVTKSDKLPREQQRARVRQLQADLGLDDEQMIATSARVGEGIDELREAIVSLIGAAHGG